MVKKKKTEPAPATRIDLGSTVVTFELPSPKPRRTEQVQIRLAKDNMALLKSLARERKISHTTLAREVVEAFLQAVRDRDDIE